MARRIELNPRIQKVYGPLAAICVVLYFLYHTIQGERGVLSWMRLRGKIRESQTELTLVKEQRDSLDRRVMLLRPNSLDLDMLEEQARKVLNFGDKSEVVIPNEELDKLLKKE